MPLRFFTGWQIISAAPLVNERREACYPSVMRLGGDATRAGLSLSICISGPGVCLATFTQSMRRSVNLGQVRSLTSGRRLSLYRLCGVKIRQQFHQPRDGFTVARIVDGLGFTAGGYELLRAQLGEVL
jgi:hypothetical protein